MDDLKRESRITRGHASPIFPHIDSKTQTKNKNKKTHASQAENFVDTSEDSRKMVWL